MAELEDDFRVAGGEPVHVGNAAAQDEGVVVEAEILGVAEHDLPYLGAQFGARVLDEPDAELLGGALHDAAEIAEGADRGEALRLQDQLGFQILHPVERRAVGVDTLGRRQQRDGRGDGFRGFLLVGFPGFQSCCHGYLPC